MNSTGAGQLKPDGSSSKPLVLLALDFPPLGGGISRYLYEIVRHWPPQRVRVIGLPVPGWPSFDAGQNFSIQRLALPVAWHTPYPPLKLLAPFYLWQLAREPTVRMIVCGQAHYSIMLPAWLVGRARGIPYGIFTYGTDLLYPQTRLYRPLFNALLRAAQVVFADSRAAASAAARCGLRPDRLHVVHPTLDPSRLKSDVSPQAVRQRHGLDNKACILTTGRLVERKGFDTVIQALPAVLAAVPEAHYVIVGRGPAEARLRALVNELGLEAHVTFAGYVPDDDLAAYYSACDVFAMISREVPEQGDIEGFGIVYLEANALGKPVVAGRSGGVEDAVVHEQTGLLVNPGDPAKVAAAVVRLLRDPELARQLGEAGRARVLGSFSSAAAAQKVWALLP